MKKDLIENTPFSRKAIRNHLQLHNQTSVIMYIKNEFCGLLMAQKQCDNIEMESIVVAGARD